MWPDVSCHDILVDVCVGDAGGAPWNTRLEPPTLYKNLSELGCDSIA